MILCDIMDVLPLVVEGIENKIKRLFLINQQLINENQQLKKGRAELEKELAKSVEKIKQLEEKMSTLNITKVLAGKDKLRARQQLNELLREIDKCYALLNR